MNAYRFGRQVLVAFIVLAGFCPGPVSGQRKGEYLTEGEMNLVKEIRKIANRSDVFMRIAERRLTALADPAGPTGDTRFMKFGPLPTGTTDELLDDYRRAIDELMNKLDDEFERTGLTPDLKKALEATLEEVERQIGRLGAMRAKMSDARYEPFFRRAIDSASLLRDGAREALASGT